MVVSTAAMKGVLPAAPRPRLPPERAAEISVVHLDPPLELRLGVFARLHGRHDFLLHQPGGRLAHAQPTAKLRRRNPAFALADVVDRQKPDLER